MHRLGSDILDAFAGSDGIEDMLAGAPEGDAALACQRWLRATPAKRYAAHVLYGDLLASEGLRVLDVGGGLTTLTRTLAERHDYTLVDIMAHDSDASISAFLASAPAFKVIKEDWFAAIGDEKFDVVIAADLFPNVDQRLALFLDRVLPHCGQVRLSLTYYNEPRFYQTWRIDADEVLCMLAWDGEQTARTLGRYADRIVNADFDLFAVTSDSVFPNKRQVCLLTLLGSQPFHVGAAE